MSFTINYLLLIISCFVSVISISAGLKRVKEVAPPPNRTVAVVKDLDRKIFDNCWDRTFDYNYFDLNEDLSNNNFKVKLTTSSDDFRQAIKVAYPKLSINVLSPSNWKNAELDFTIEQSNRCKRNYLSNNGGKLILSCSFFNQMNSSPSIGMKIFKGKSRNSFSSSGKKLLVEDKIVYGSLSISKESSNAIPTSVRALNVNFYSVKINLEMPSGKKIFSFNSDFPLDNKGNCIK